MHLMTVFHPNLHLHYLLAANLFTAIFTAGGLVALGMIKHL